MGVFSDSCAEQFAQKALHPCDTFIATGRRYSACGGNYIGACILEVELLEGEDDDSKYYILEGYPPGNANYNEFPIGQFQATGKDTVCGGEDLLYRCRAAPDNVPFIGELLPSVPYGSQVNVVSCLYTHAMLLQVTASPPVKSASAIF